MGAASASTFAAGVAAAGPVIQALYSMVAVAKGAVVAVAILLIRHE